MELSTTPGAILACDALGTLIVKANLATLFHRTGYVFGAKSLSLTIITTSYALPQSLYAVANEHLPRPIQSIQQRVDRPHPTHDISITIPPQDDSEDNLSQDSDSIPPVAAALISCTSLPAPSPRTPVIPLFAPRRVNSFAPSNNHAIEYQLPKPTGVAEYQYLPLGQQNADRVYLDSIESQSYYRRTLANSPPNRIVVLIGRDSALGIRVIRSPLPVVLQPGTVVFCVGEKMWGEWEVTQDHHISNGRVYNLWVNHGTHQRTHVAIGFHLICLRLTVAERLKVFMCNVFRR